MNIRVLVLAVFMAIATVATVAYAAPSTVDVQIVINDDKTTDWDVGLFYKENVTKSDFYVLARITAVEVSVNNTFVDCTTTKRDIGTGIICPELPATDKVTYKFHGYDTISNFEGLQIFSQRFPITELVDKITITAKLPLGTAVVEQSKISGTGLQRFEPVWGKEGSDGRRIYVIWERSSPKLGEAINVSIIYEQILDNQAGLIMIPAIGAMFIILIYIFRKRFAKDIMPILTDNERKVMEIIIREKKDVDQRSIVRETDYSKSKVSRVLRNLENRGLIERFRKGRTNMVKFKRK